MERNRHKSVRLAIVAGIVAAVIAALFAYDDYSLGKYAKEYISGSLEIDPGQLTFKRVYAPMFYAPGEWVNLVKFSTEVPIDDPSLSRDDSLLVPMSGPKSLSRGIARLKAKAQHGELLFKGEEIEPDKAILIIVDNNSREVYLYDYRF